MRTFHSFKDIDNFQKFLRSKYPNCHKGIDCLDYVKIGGVLYTMHEFDMGGQFITWANKRTGHVIQVETRNRYKNGYEDAEVISFFATFIRSDIAYAD